MTEDIELQIDRLEFELSELRRRLEPASPIRQSEPKQSPRRSQRPGCICRPATRAWQPSGVCSACGHNILESQLTPVVLQILCANTGLTLWRNAAGYDTVRKVRYGLAVGSGDFVGCWTPGGARYVEIELKTPAGRLSEEQLTRRDLIVRLKGIYAVVRSQQHARELISYLQRGGQRPAFVFEGS